jgi:murein DD-endopeptidase MepM/ murein hydrolase activator NlpD
MSHRRAIDERLAPWALMGLILAAWWAGARLVQWSGWDEQLRARAGAGAQASPTQPSEAHGVPRAPTSPDRSDPMPAASLAGNGPPRASTTSARSTPAITFQDIIELRDRALAVPVEGVTPDVLVSSYRDLRNGARPHEAIDIMAPRGAPVVAADSGRIVKLFTSVRGGLTIYQFDDSARFAYYYAHLDGYAPGLREGHQIHREQTLGFVGTTGNAPSDAPHLHFAVFKLGPERRWWEGTPVDPFMIWR